jgi:acetyl-CoA carboxylase biotin carboxylase subunit
VLENAEAAIETARRIGYPVIVKASAGGGGRGMRIVREESEMAGMFAQAQQEAGAAFSCADVYLEKFIEAPRHIEFQILADEHGNVEILGERECSIQRRHQKLIEESPSPKVTKDLRQRLSDKLRVAMKAVGYTNAGTVEFLMDESGDLYFIEVNARIQVEHPVTEEVTGLDLLKEQIRIAAGEKLPVTQDEVTLRGHSIECRINAEDPDRNFRPAPGTITYWYKPGGPGVRVDSHVYQGYKVPPNYDSLIAKVITRGKDREEARRRMLLALEEIIVEGVPTTVPFHLKALASPRFIKGDLDTGIVAAWFQEWAAAPSPAPAGA